MKLVLLDGIMYNDQKLKKINRRTISVALILSRIIQLF